MVKPLTNFPDLINQVSDAFFEQCKSGILLNYFGGKCAIKEDWESYKPYVHARLIADALGLPAGSKSTNCARQLLRFLVEQGLLTEDQPHRINGGVNFRIADKEHEKSLLKDAFDCWTSYGYAVGKPRERTHK